MEGRKNPPPRSAGSKSRSPAERAVEFTATQRRLKDEATARRKAAAKGDEKPKG
jgi:hypothetical protein